MPTMWSRRSVLRQIGSGASLLAGNLIWTPAAHAEDLSTSERIALIYSHRFQFDAAGEAIVTIGVAEGLDQVSLYAPAGVELGLAPSGGTRIRGAGLWQLHVERGESSRQIYSLELARAAMEDASTLRSAERVWKKRGIATRRVESGTLSGLRGRVLDTRIVSLVHGKFQSSADARSQAREINRQFSISPTVRSEVESRPSGVIVARDPNRGTTLRAEGALWFFPDRDPIEIRVEERSLGSHGRLLTRGRRFRGSVYVAIDRFGRLTVVNELRETELLAGVVPSEIHASASPAALHAQAIAARGQLLAKIGHRHEDAPFALCADIHCQAYGGMDVEDPRTNAAVTQSRGELLMRPGGTHLVDTVYSANCGGYSEHNENVWPGPPDPQLRAQPDLRIPEEFRSGISERNLEAWLTHRPPAHCCPAHGENDAYRWTQVLDLEALVSAPDWTLPRSKINGLRVLERGKSGRATVLGITVGVREARIEGELTIRRLLGGLRSSMFILQRVGTHTLAVGGGHGHGVGMCQYGAMGMAKAGMSREAILTHYYRGGEIQRLW